MLGGAKIWNFGGATGGRSVVRAASSASIARLQMQYSMVALFHPRCAGQNKSLDVRSLIK
jgi:hypothetical protein